MLSKSYLDFIPNENIISRAGGPPPPGGNSKLNIHIIQILASGSGYVVLYCEPVKNLIQPNHKKVQLTSLHWYCGMGLENKADTKQASIWEDGVSVHRKPYMTFSNFSSTQMPKQGHFVLKVIKIQQ